jgi:putative membrane protein
MARHTTPLLCLGITTLVFIWSGIDPVDRFTWWLEVIPALIAVPLLMVTYHRFPLTRLLYCLISVHACILMVGGHYTYAEVPLFSWLRDVLGTARNSFDGVGHFAQGFIPAMILRELLLRTSPLQSGKWLFALIVFCCLGVSALYELIEWIAAMSTGEAAEAFLGTQGDQWDTQKDIALAGIGAIVAQITLFKWHNKQLLEVQND